MKRAFIKFIGFLLVILQMACVGRKESKITNTGTSIILEGHYNGNNLFVKNPYRDDGFGFCINEILINGDRTSDEIASETIEIDLKASGVMEGHEITIELKHNKGCEPTILNPDVLK